MEPEALHFSRTLDDASKAATGAVPEVVAMLGLEQLCQLPEEKKYSDPSAVMTLSFQ